MESLQKEFDQYYNLETLDGKKGNEQVDIIGRLIDLSFDLNREDGVRKAFELAKTIDKTEISPTDLIVYHYDIANGWSVIRKLNRSGITEDWDFEQEELNNEIVNLRIALNHPSFGDLQLERQCQILTNLGNLFSYIGRFVESQELWNRSISIIPQFAMAIANKGYGLISYAKLLPNEDHVSIFFNLSYYLLKRGISLKEYLEFGAEDFFQNAITQLESNISKDLLEADIDLDDFPLGKTEEEKKYRRWCLDKYLFLHPLNDVTNQNYAAYDSLMLPKILSKVGEPPTYHNLFNQIKQEFTSARYFAYEGLNFKEQRIADKDVTLTNTNELLSYSHNLEKVKIAFRVCYSLFDKIAYFLNAYFELKIPEKKVNFRTLWFEGNNKELKTQISTSKNWALRGLYWLSKDLFDYNLKDSIDPDSKELADIRNFLEHKSFKVKEFSAPNLNFLIEPDNISFSITREEFESKTIKLLKLSRAAIFYLTYAISQAEIIKAQDIKQDFIPTLPMDLFPDEYKI